MTDPSFNLNLTITTPDGDDGSIPLEWGPGLEWGPDVVFGDPPPPTIFYANTQQLRDHLGVNASTLGNSTATDLILAAEDLIDDDLGAWPIDPNTGRKIIEGTVEAWQWTKLNRATVALAGLLYRNPDAAVPGKQYARVKGPDFEFWGPKTGAAIGGGTFGPSVDAPLNQSGLRRLTTVMGNRGGRPPWYSFAYNDTSWDYDPPRLPTQT